MLQVNTKVQTHIENGLGTAMIGIGELTRLKFDGSTLWQDCDFRHAPDYPIPPGCKPSWRAFP